MKCSYREIYRDLLGNRHTFTDIMEYLRMNPNSPNLCAGIVGSIEAEQLKEQVETQAKLEGLI